MSKYNIMATKADWENLYQQVVKFPELDLKKFKKSQNLDSAQYAFYAFLRREKGISYENAKKQFPIYRYDNTIQAVIN